MLETTDTSSQFGDDIPNGTFLFEVHKVVSKEIGGKKAYEWTLDYKDSSGADCTGKQLMWPSQMGNMLRVLDAKETSQDKFQWETDMMPGKKFKATVKRETNEKKPGKQFQVMVAFEKVEEKDEIPF